MNKESISLKINQIVNGILNNTAGLITDGAGCFRWADISSVDFIKIIVSIEEEFGFEFDDEDLEIGRFSSLEELIDYTFKRCQNI